jgi:hypothetical protein
VQNFSVPHRPRPSADQLQEQLHAKRILARLDQFGHLAQSWEREPSQLLRQDFADRYRRLFGVSPAHHAELRAALERVRDGGGMPLADVIDVLNDTTR